MSDKRESLAALEHEQWAHWTRYMLDVLEPLLAYGRGVMREASRHGFGDAKAIKSLEAIKRWNRQINTPYEALTEKEQESDRVWADKVLEIVNKGGSSEAGSRNLDGEIIELMQSIFSHAHFIVETPAESVLVKLMKERGNPIDIDGSVTDMEADYRRYLEDKEADWKEDLHHSLLLKIADIIDSQLRLEGQCPGASQLGPGTVAAAIRTAVKNHKEA